LTQSVCGRYTGGSLVEHDDAEARDATRGSAVKLGAELLGRSLGLVTTLLIARGLGASEYGAWGVLSVVALVAAEASDLGLQGTASRALVARTLPLSGLLRAKRFLTVLFLVPALAVLPRWPMLTALLLYYAFAGWAEFLGVALRARGFRGQEVAVIFLWRVAGFLVVGASLLAGSGGIGLSWALALSTVPPILLGTALVRRAYREAEEAKMSAHSSDPTTVAILRASAPLAVNGGLALLSLRVELLAVKFLRGDAQAGLFLAALRVIEFLNLIPNALCAGAMPALTREALRREGLVRRRTAATVALAAAPAALGLALVALPLVGLLYGPGYDGAEAPLAILALALVPLFLNGVQTHGLIAAERASWLPRLTAVRVVAAVVLATVLVPRYGAVGAAGGFLASELLLLVLGSRACAAAAFPIPVVKVATLALLLALPMAALVAPWRGTLAVAVSAGIVIYAATLLLVFGLAPRWRRDLGYS
jgi:O-antigen/teichoic acid export membrane protein